MASLRTMVGLYKDELREGIAWVAFWREGRSWEASAFWLDDHDEFEPEDLEEVKEILEADPDAVFINGYHNCPFGDGGGETEVSSIDFMMEHIRWRYEDHLAPLSAFYHEKEKEDKQEICDLLLPALQATREYKDLISLTYDKESEYVVAKFSKGIKSINVTMDSGAAMIRDIMRRLE